LEHNVKAAVEHNKLGTTKQPMEFIERSTGSASLSLVFADSYVRTLPVTGDIARLALTRLSPSHPRQDAPHFFGRN
jgi:hypothetical protein